MWGEDPREDYIWKVSFFFLLRYMLFSKFKFKSQNKERLFGHIKEIIV